MHIQNIAISKHFATTSADLDASATNKMDLDKLYDKYGEEYRCQNS